MSTTLFESPTLVVTRFFGGVKRGTMVELHFKQTQVTVTRPATESEKAR